MRRSALAALSLHPLALNFSTPKCLLKITVLSVTCLSDHNKRGFNVMAASFGRTEHAKQEFPNESTERLC